MAAVPYAHIVANILRGKKLKGATVNLAPNPKDIVGVAGFVSCRSSDDCFTDLGELESDER